MKLTYTVAVCTFMAILQTIDCSSNIKRYDICRPINQKKVYTTIGSRGIVFVKTDMFNYSKLNITTRDVRKDSFYKQCSLHIISCPSCMINLRFKDVNLTCSNGHNTDDDKELVCNSICIVEPPYSERSLQCVNGTMKNASIFYKSLTSQVNLNFVNRHLYSHAFTVEYLITRNIQLAETKPEFSSANISFGGYISTPFFPISHPNDLTFEQVISCKVSVTACRIHLIFEDFLIAEESVVEFYDSDRKRLGIAGGAMFRPPVILSSGPMLYIKFFANDGSSTGYKAQYSYVRGSVKNSILKPNTNCGGFVENKGGAITMMHMVEELEPDVLFDCIWIFRKSHKYYHLKSQYLFMKFVTLKDLIHSNLVVREGHTSNGRLLRWRNGSDFVELTVPIEVGYYVRLTGTFNSSSRLEIAYAAFSQSRPCGSASEFSCKNERCIPNRLRCDGFDHCGDNSDESTECFDDNDGEPEYTDKSWYAYKSNYYFPNNTLYSKQYHILLGCFIGFILFFATVLVIVYRIATRYHFQTDFHDRLVSISQLLLEGIQLNSPQTPEITRIRSNYLIDEPPDYEAPPDYDEAIKMCSAVKCNTESNSNGCTIRNTNINNDNQMLSSTVNDDYPVTTTLHCLCCDRASYRILALDVNNMNRCCLSKIYSLRTSTINNQY